jgi:uncharacterized protein
MAKEHPDVGGLVLISPYTSIPDVTMHLPELWYLRPLPVRLLSHSKFDNLSKIDSVHVPVFIAVGTADENTIPTMAQALFQKANEPKRLYLSLGAAHNNIWEIKTEELLTQIRAFMQTLR